ncbi:DUF484 domain-containing protein [Photobacterium sanctipauli]|uniref:DUF484 domain-containing protein n=2 Tax=Photobacterium sanctipauli TaxID=1342794 RepID=A0A2T3NEU7_9GAMM|nr:DUF484 family protein [Photobacterium sanctipauli]PSW13080.1 DUF484 domain-containing protein [Photobacterium sanctipauli]
MTDVYQFDALSPAQTTELSEQDVADFLQAHPDFFIRHPDLLTRIQVHHADRGVVSLVDIQLERLRAQVGELEGKMADLVSAAAKNSQLFDIFAQAQQQLFQTHNIYQALLVLEELAEQLGLEVSLRLFDSLDEQLFLDRREFEGMRRSRLVSRPVYLGRLRKQESELLFEQPPHLGSFVVLPLGGNERPIGVLSFASVDGGHFQPEMDTLFVEQLAHVLARLIHHWEYTREVLE